MSLEVGNKIDGWCGPCKSVSRHTIEAMTAEKIKRVHCNTCGGRHAHRAHPPGTRRGAAAAALTQERRYGQLLRGRGERHDTERSPEKVHHVSSLGERRFDILMTVPLRRN